MPLQLRDYLHYINDLSCILPAHICVTLARDSYNHVSGTCNWLIVLFCIIIIIFIIMIMFSTKQFIVWSQETVNI